MQVSESESLCDVPPHVFCVSHTCYHLMAGVPVGFRGSHLSAPSDAICLRSQSFDAEDKIAAIFWKPKVSYPTEFLAIVECDGKALASVILL